MAALVLLACSLAVQCLPRRIRAFALMAAVPVLAQCLQAVSTDIGVFLYFKLLPKLWALALWLLLFCLLWGLLGSPGLAGGVCVTVSVLLALLNLALLQFRGTALQWQDIGSWRAALNVAGGYRLALSHKNSRAGGAVAVGAGGPALGGRPVRGRAPVGRVPGGHGPWGRCSRCAVVGLAAHSGQRGDLLLHQHQNAFVANLFLQSRDLPLKKPKDYEARLLRLEQYSSDASTKVSQTPDIVAIMNESFADLRCYGGADRPGDLPGLGRDSGPVGPRHGLFLGVRRQHPQRGV